MQLLCSLSINVQALGPVETPSFAGNVLLDPLTGFDGSSQR